MIDHGLWFDALIQPRHLPMLARFVEHWPELPVVIDHGAKPYAARGELDPWRADIARLADRGVYCKLSGLRTEQAAGQGADALAPFVDHLAATFGERLMWGSDWPALTMCGDDYGGWLGDARRLAERSGLAEARLFAECAREFHVLAR